MVGTDDCHAPADATFQMKLEDEMQDANSEYFLVSLDGDHRGLYVPHVTCTF